mmetsp:Transcript_37273/g.73280  ORF Transcript_37273/g.73280 Transcript_37273/m.73280 type:complete len:620 (-) Transcript_37273:180-2039(-)
MIKSPQPTQDVQPVRALGASIFGDLWEEEGLDAVATGVGLLAASTNQVSKSSVRTMSVPGGNLQTGSSGLNAYEPQSTVNRRSSILDLDSFAPTSSLIPNLADFVTNRSNKRIAPSEHIMSPSKLFNPSPNKCLNTARNNKEYPFLTSSTTNNSPAQLSVPTTPTTPSTPLTPNDIPSLSSLSSLSSPGYSYSSLSAPVSSSPLSPTSSFKTASLSSSASAGSKVLPFGQLDSMYSSSSTSAGHADVPASEATSQSQLISPFNSFAEDIAPSHMTSSAGVPAIPFSPMTVTTQRHSSSSSSTKALPPLVSSTVDSVSRYSAIINNFSAVSQGSTMYSSSSSLSSSTASSSSSLKDTPPGSPSSSFVPPALYSDDEDDESEDDLDAKSRKRKKKGKAGGRSRVQKGLRHFSLKVCEKVQQQNVTTYNKVADDLVKELTNPATAGIGSTKVYEEKNIRRRVYDALNVLMAMGIISKEKKAITWIGLPGGVTEDLLKLREQKKRKVECIKQKQEQLSHFLTQQVCFKNLVTRNATELEKGNVPAGKLEVPFVLVRCQQASPIQLKMSEDKKDMYFEFSDRFWVLDHQDILKALKLAKIASWDLPRLLPRDVCPFYPSEHITT